MKIYIPVLGFGKSGGFRVLSELANHFIAKGYEVTFICVVSDQLSLPYFPTQSSIIYVDLFGNQITFNDIRKTILFKRTFLRLRQLVALSKAINKFTSSEDVILANYSLTAFSVYFSKKSDNKFYYIQAYESEYFSRSLKGIISSFLVKFTYSLDLKRIVNSPIYYSFKNLKAKDCVFPGIDFQIFNSSGKIHRRDRNRLLTIGCIGRIEQSKGTIYVLEAYNKLKLLGVNVELNIAVFGNNEQFPNDIKQTYINNDAELAKYYKDLDVLIAPGILQFGAVHYPVIEAMASGTPVITTFYYPACQDTAWLCSPRDSQSIVEELLKIVENPELAVTKSLLAEKTIQHLSWPNVAQSMIDIFNRK